MWWFMLLGWTLLGFAIVALNLWASRNEVMMSAEERKAVNDNAHYELQQW